MGDAADDLEAWEFDQWFYPFGIDLLMPDENRDKNRETLAEVTWKTKDGEIIKLRDMTTDHLLAVLKIQERLGHKYAPQLRDYWKYRVTMERTPRDT